MQRTLTRPLEYKSKQVQYNMEIQTLIEIGIIFATLAASVDYVSSAETLFVLTPTTDVLCDSEPLTSFGTTRSRLHCGVKCAGSSGCISFFFNVDDLSCRGSASILTDLTGCSPETGTLYYADQEELLASQVSSQWVASVDDFSTQYGTTSWSANQITGPPNVYPAYGNNVKSWAPLTINAFQFIEVRFATAVYITGVDIYETDHCGAVWRVSARDSASQLHVLWVTQSATVIYQARIFSPPITRTTYKSAVVRLDVDQTASNTYIEIDAVALNGNEN